MAYHVIKTIKGRQYLYRQEGFREGDKVRTRSTYIGPVTEANRGLVSKSSSGSAAASPSESAGSSFSASKPAERASSGQNAKSPPPASSEIFRSKVNLKKQKISEESLHRQQVIFTNRMASKGVDVSKMPPIVIKRGLSLGHKRSFGKKQLIVTLPRTGVNRGEFRKECFKAQGRLAIEAFSQQQPEKFLKLSQHFDQSFRKSQGLISDYIRNARGKSAKFRAIALKVWGNTAQLHKHLPEPDKVGVYDYSSRKSWQDEAVSIYAEMNRKGASAFRQNLGEKMGMARNELDRAETDLKNLTFFNMKKGSIRRRAARARARYENMREMNRKVEVVKELFY